MSEHRTPGPWKAAHSIDGSSFGIYPDTAKMEFPIAKMPSFVRSEVNAANALLIAAAPELLDALRYFCEQMDSFRERDGNQADAYYCFVKGHDAAWARARAAIAKAEDLNPGVGAGS